MTIRIITGPALVGHIFADESEAIARAVPVLVYHYALATGLDIHPAEVYLCEVRRIARDGTRAAAVTTEVRDGAKVIASWRAVGQGTDRR